MYFIYHYYDLINVHTINLKNYKTNLKNLHFFLQKAKIKTGGYMFIF